MQKIIERIIKATKEYNNALTCCNFILCAQTHEERVEIYRQRNTARKELVAARQQMHRLRAKQRRS